MATPRQPDHETPKTPVSEPPGAAARETKRPTDSVPIATGNFTKLPVRFGRYQVEKLLGKGAMGAVYLARDTQLERRVALKIPKLSASAKGSEKLLKRLKTEAMAAAQIDHPSVCPVFDSGDIEGTHYIAMQYIEGETLKDHLQNQAKTSQEAIEIIRQLAEGLAEAHSRKIYHRDLKPENIKLNRRGVPVIMDFGLAKLATTIRADASATQAGTTLGTPAYMSPEQANGQVALIDHRSDIYALGVMLYEMLTGTWPFLGSSIQVMALKTLQEAPSPVTVKPELNPQLAAVCQKLIAREQENRYQTAGEVIAALNAVKFGGTQASGPTAAPETPRTEVDPKFPKFETDAGSLAANIGRQGKAAAVSKTAANSLPTIRELVAGSAPAPTASRNRRDRTRTSPANAALQKIWIGTAAGMLLVAVLVLWAAGVFNTNRATLAVDVNASDAKNPPVTEPAFPTPGAPAAAPAIPVTEIDRTQFTAFSGSWSVEGNELLQTDSNESFPVLVFGDTSWTDYEVSVDMMRVEGSDQGAIAFRVADGNFYLFGIGTTRNGNLCKAEVHEGQNWFEIGSSDYQTYNHTWYNVRARVEGGHIECFLSDGNSEMRVFDLFDDRFSNGCVALRVFRSAYRFRNIRVTALDGTVLWEGTPALP